MKQSRIFIQAGAAIIVALLFAGCSLLLGGGGETATLVVSFSPELTARTIEPELSMEVHHYEVSGTGPRGASFLADDVAPGDAVVESSLLPGEWTITVEAFNAPTTDFPDGKLIGRGVATVTIVSGEVLALTITVTPIDDVPGTLDIGISWPAGVLTSEELSATLVPSGVTADPSVHGIEFLPEDVSPRVGSRYTNTALDPGYYLFSVQLLDFGTTPVWGTVEAVRIVAGEPSEKDYELVEDVNRGGIGIGIEPELDNPFTITLSVADGATFPEGAPVTVTATAVDATVDSWSWFLRGAPLADGSGGVTIASDSTTSTVTLAGLPYAFYRLSVVASEGAVLASATLDFEVEEAVGEGLIVFRGYLDNRYDLFTINPDGSGLTRLTNSDRVESHPVWSPDATRIAFDAYSPGASSSEIYVINADGSGEMQITNGAEHARRPTWSGDGTRIAYVGYGSGGNDREVRVIDLAGGTISNVTNNAFSDETPRWSNLGKRIAFASTRGATTWDLYTINSDGTDERLVAGDAGTDAFPDWRPDDGRIAYGATGTTGRYRVVLIDPDGTNSSVLWDSADGSFFFASWSPDGTRLAFYGSTAAGQQIYVMGVTDSSPVAITPASLQAYSPDWSPR